MMESLPSLGYQLPSVNVIGFILFFLECYHIVGHACVLFRIRLLPRKDLKTIRYYFLIDAMTVFTTNFLYTGKLRWLAALQNIQHLFFFITWRSDNKYTEKVISWSSLDWILSPKMKQLWAWDVILGTSFDIGVHVINAFILSQYLSTAEIMFSLVVVQGSSMMVLFSPKFAWASPSYIPGWIQRRIKPLESVTN